MKFIVVTRPFDSKSQGCVLLHKLAHTLNEVGHEATILFFIGHGSETKGVFSVDSKFYCEEYKNIFLSDERAFEKFKEGAVVIYPEIITGNPLGGDYVVRYMLNREGFIKAGVMINPSERDFILTHSYHYHRKPHFHLYNYNGSKFFNKSQTEKFNKRKIDLTYIGKGAKYVACSVLNGTQEVTRRWPETKLELANLLKQSRYIYTWDTLSATVHDAISCGAFPIFMTYAPITKDEVYNLIDLGISIPEITYEETLGQLSENRLEEIEAFMISMVNKTQGLESDYKQNVANFSFKVMEHFGINI
jgi:hypothetical protein